MAQDFFASFGRDAIGTIGTPPTINSGNMAGILMIAVQALEKQNAELKARLEAMGKEKGTSLNGTVLSSIHLRTARASVGGMWYQPETEKATSYH